MQPDLIVEEVRKNGREFTARYDNDISKICAALKEKEKLLDRQVVNRPPQYVKRRAASY